jgi:hypothetical protein
VDTYSTQLALCLGVENVNIARHAFSKVSFQGGVGIDASGLNREYFGNTYKLHTAGIMKGSVCISQTLLSRQNIVKVEVLYTHVEF